MSGHGHDHHHPTDDRRRLLVVLAITGSVMVAEVIGAVLSGSLALLADAGHMLTDTAGLLIAFVAATLAARPAAGRRTWGYQRAEILAATLQAAILLAVGVYVLIEGVRRLLEPPEVGSTAMLVFGAIGLAGNLVGIAVLARSRGNTLNMRAAFLEVVNDALGSVAVLIAAVVIATTGWLRADALVSVLIGLLILPRTVVLLREALDVLLESAPRELDLEDIRTHLLRMEHVHAVHDLHVTRIATRLPVLTAHVVIDDSCFLDGHAPQVLDQLQSCLNEHFPISIEHSTFQLEPVGHAAHEPTTHS